MANRRSQRRTSRPVCEALESRALLNAAMAEPAQHEAAEIQITRRPILPNLTQLPFSPVSTVPTNGDTNPYGVAFVPNGFPSGGRLNPGDILVSNFNNSGGLQGTGTTIVKFAPNGTQSPFFQGTSPGLDTALAVLKSGFVLVGNVPTTDGTFGTIQQGSLQVLDKNGNVVKTLTDSQLLDGPWDLAVNDRPNDPQVFVSNVLSGTVTRIDLSLHGNQVNVVSETQIASGYAHRSDPAALVLGPTGLVFNAKTDTLYVASTADNKIFAVSNASKTQRDHGTGRVIYNDPAHLRGPLGLAQAPNGDLITANGDAVNTTNNQPNSELVEFTPHGKFVAQFQVDTAVGAAFGLAISPANSPANPSPNKRVLAAVDDANNTLEEFTFPIS